MYLILTDLPAADDEHMSAFASGVVYGMLNGDINNESANLNRSHGMPPARCVAVAERGVQDKEQEIPDKLGRAKVGRILINFSKCSKYFRVLTAHRPPTPSTSPLEDHKAAVPVRPNFTAQLVND